MTTGVGTPENDETKVGEVGRSVGLVVGLEREGIKRSFSKSSTSRNSARQHVSSILSLSRIRSKIVRSGGRSTSISPA